MKIIKTWKFKEERYYKTDEGFYKFLHPKGWVRLICEDGEWQPLEPLKILTKEEAIPLEEEDYRLRKKEVEQYEFYQKHIAPFEHKRSYENNEYDECFSEAYGGWCN